MSNAQEPQAIKITPKVISGAILNSFTGCMSPLVPLFVAFGMVNVITALIGPLMLNLVSADSGIYTNFYNLGQSIIYFLPVFVAITAAKQFECSPLIALALATLMLFPGMMTALSVEGGYTIYGLPAPNIAYNAQLIPILLVVYAQSHIEKLLTKIIPETFSIIGVPFTTLLIMLPFTFVVFGPIGFYIGSALARFVLWLYDVAGPVQTTLTGAFSLFMLAFGISRPIFFICLTMFINNGVEYSFLPIAMVTGNFTAAGIAAAYIIKTKSRENKQLGVSSLAVGMLGGISEPTLLGIIIPNRKTYIPLIISGGLAGLTLGLLRVGYYQYGPTNFLSPIGFLGGNENNFFFGIAAALIAFISAFMAMLFLYKDT